MADQSRRFTVLWKSRNRNKHSAVMTQPEAEIFAARLRVENLQDVSIREDTGAPFALLRARYLLQTMSRPAAIPPRAMRFPVVS